MFRYILITLFFLIHITNIDSIRQRRQTNGCGPTSGPDLNPILKKFQMDILIQCCDTHDYCYENCTYSRTKCDNHFHQCLHKTCASVERTGFQFWIRICEWFCFRIGDIMYHVTNLFGQQAFDVAQKNNSCTSEYA